MEDLIFRYLDGECTVTEIETVEARLETDHEFATVFAQLHEANELLMNSSLDMPKRGFANRVMKSLQVQRFPAIQDSFIVKIGLAMLLFLVAAFTLVAVPELGDYINLSLPDILSRNTIVYATLLLFFFMVLDWFLTKRAAKLKP